MILHLHSKQILILFILVLFGVTNYAQNDIPAGDVTVVKTFPVSGKKVINSPNQYDPNAAYSNVDNYTGSGYANGNVGVVSGTRTSVMVADDINFITVGLSAPYSISKFYWSVANFNAAAASARPTVRLYLADGAGGGPGTYITGFLFNPINLNAGSGGVVSYTPAAPIAITSPNIWAGLYWDNGGTSTATNTQLASFGQLMFDPPATGTSGDQMFITTNQGTFAASNPAGTIYPSPFAAAPVASFGWEFISAVALPVNIEYFRGTKANNIHNLTWKINCTSTSGVNISLERSIDNRTFSTIYNEKANAVRCQQAFNYSDRSPANGTNYYRLKLTDADGKITYSAISAIINKLSGFEIVSISPNPSADVATLNLSSAQQDKADVAVMDVAGKVVINQSQALIAGSNQIQLKVTNLPAGIYKVSIRTANGDMKTSTLMKK